MPLPDFEALAIFATVAEQGSFARAAEMLRLSKPTVSKAVARLEHRLGVPLLHRTSRRLALTPNGETILARARTILEQGEAAEAEAAAEAAAPRGAVRMAAPMSFGTRCVAPLIPAFLDAYPEVTLELDFSDTVVDLVGDGFDLALRIGTLADSSLRARRLCAVPLMIVAAPGYLARHGRPAHPRDIARHRVLLYTNAASPGVWRFRRDGEEEQVVAISGRLSANTAEALMPDLLSGGGLALLPEFLVWDALRDGRLDTVLADWTLPEIALHIVMPPSAIRPARVAVLVEWLARRLSDAPWTAGPPAAAD